jgi:predicted DNA-binding protein
MKKLPRTFTLDPALLERLKNYSDKTDIPQARIVEVAIEKHLDQLEKGGK